jgi:hypothetical protein
MDFDKASRAVSNPGSTPPVHQPTKAKKLSKAKKEIADRFETALGNEWVNDAGKWVQRIKGVGAMTEEAKEAMRDKCERVVAEVENAIREGRIDTTPARFAEDTWKHFA